MRLYRDWMKSIFTEYGYRHKYIRMTKVDDDFLTLDARHSAQLVGDQIVDEISYISSLLDRLPVIALRQVSGTTESQSNSQALRWGSTLNSKGTDRMTREIIYSVFVSSTYDDLRKERAEVQKSLLKLHCMPIGMELFGSADEETWDFIKRQVDDCDYCIVMVADRYGSTADDGLSYTEKEYDYARLIDKPVLAFVHGDRGSIPRDKTEKDPERRQKLEAFIEKIKQSPVSSFTTPHELAKEVAVSFANLRDRRRLIPLSQGAPYDV
jgi:hypothetical protein